MVAIFLTNQICFIYIHRAPLDHSSPISTITEVYAKDLLIRDRMKHPTLFYNFAIDYPSFDTEVYRADLYTLFRAEGQGLGSKWGVMKEEFQLYRQQMQNINS